MKKFWISFLLLACVSDASALMVTKKPKASQASEKVSNTEVFKDIKPETRQDLSALSKALHREHQAMFQELRDNEELATKDLAMLWQAAVERSGTLRYAIEKLSRRDATGATQDTFTKRMLQSLAHVGGVAGSLWMQNPAGILGGNMVQEALANDPNRGAPVTDADMVILAKEVEALQSLLMESYYNYCQRESQWKLSQEAHRKLAQYSNTDKLSSALRPLLDSLVESSEHDELTAKQAFISARNSLGLLVGGEALLALEKSRTVTAAYQE
jgi:hypothetical protein